MILTAVYVVYTSLTATQMDFKSLEKCFYKTHAVGISHKSDMEHKKGGGGGRLR